MIQLEKSIDNFQYNQRQKFLRENPNVTREQVEQFDAIQAKAKADRLRDEEISFWGLPEMKWWIPPLLLVRGREMYYQPQREQMALEGQTYRTLQPRHSAWH